MAKSKKISLNDLRFFARRAHRGVFSFVRQKQSQVIDWSRYPKLLTIRQTAEILGVHPNTLRAWDIQGRLRAIRIGARRDRRYEQADIAALATARRQSSVTTIGYHWVVAVLHRRQLIQRLAVGVAAVIICSWAGFNRQFVRADQAVPATVAVSPQDCRGWTGSSLVTRPDVPANGTSKDFTDRNSATYDSWQHQVSSTTGSVATGSLDAPDVAITCQHFSAAGIPSGAKVNHVDAVVSLSSTVAGNSTADMALQASPDGQNWSTIHVFPLSAELPVQTVWPITVETLDQLNALQLRLVPEVELGSPRVVARLDALQLRVTITPPVSSSPQQDARSHQQLDQLTSFSKSTYNAQATPVFTVPKKHPKKVLFITVGQTTWSLRKVQLVDQKGKVAEATYDVHDQAQGETVDSTISLRTTNMHPGKYGIRVTMTSSDGGTATIEKSFLWGVVALNFRRAAPQPNEDETVGMAVLDDVGKTICNAEVAVKVTDPRGHAETFRTSKQTIIRNPTCVDKGVTNEPDYHFSFTPHLAGTYHVSFVAKTSVGQRVYEDNLFVSGNKSFDVQRSEYPTRINPYAAYPVRIAVTPHRDYSGLVYERVPANFKISALPTGTVLEDDPANPGMKRIRWEVQWQHGNTYYLSYTFVAPAISPALFTTGPLSVGGDDLQGAEFTEPRQWQIASDSANSLSWNGGTSNLWSNPLNWTPNVIPQAGDNLVFPAGASNKSNTNDLGENYLFNSITFNDSGYTLAGNTIILGQGAAGITDAVTTGGNTISLNLRFDATTQTFRQITVTNSGETLTISGTIAGAGGLSKEGVGTLILSGGNKYGGVTKINSGVLSARNDTALGTIANGTEVVGEAALELQGTIAIGREPLKLRGYGVSNNGALRNVLNNNSFDGQITLEGIAEIQSDSGVLTLNGGVTGTIPLILDGAGDITFAKAPIATSTGLVTKNGAGTVTFNFPNTYTGLTTINAGLVEYGCDNALLSGGITVNGGTLDMNTFSDMVGSVTLGTLLNGSGTITGTTGVLSSASYTLNAGTVSAIIAGDVVAATQITKTTFGTVTLTRPNLFTGNVVVSVGILKIQDSAALGTIDGTTSVTSGATLQVDGDGMSIPEYITLAGGFGLNNVGALVNSTGDNTITGQMTLSTSAVSIESSTANKTLTIATGGLTGAQPLTIDGDGNTTISGPIATSTGTLTKNGAGTLTLSAFNSFTGATTVNFGTLLLNGNGSIVMSASVSINSASLLKLDNTSVVTDRIGDAAGVTMNGGDLELYGSSSTNTMATAGALTMSTGQNTISVFAAAGGSTILRFTSLTRTAGATGLFRGTSLGANPGANVATILFSTAPTLVGDDGVSGTPTVSIIPGIFGDNSTSGSGTDMVTYGRGNNNGVRLLNGAGFSNEYTTDYLVTNANVKLTTATAAVTSRINSLILSTGASITNPGTSQTITFTAGNILNTVSSSIDGANTTLAAGTVEFAIRTPANLDISSLITTTGGLSKAGLGTLTFSSAKNYTGLTSINAGTLLYGVANAINDTVAVNINDATLDMATYNDTVGVVIVQGGTITGSSGELSATSFELRNATVSAILAGSSTVTVTNTNERADAASILTRSNKYSGTTTLTSGILKLGAAGDSTNTPLGTTAGSTTISNGAMLDLNGFTLGSTEAINTFRGTGIAGQGAIINSSTTPVTYNGALTVATSARIGADFGKITIGSGGIACSTLPLTIGGFGDIDITGAITGTSCTVTKEGFGIYTPSNAGNTYTGATTINAGTLKLGVSSGTTNSPLGSGATAVAITSGAVLDMAGFSMNMSVSPKALTLAGTGNGTGNFASGALINNSASAVTWSGIPTFNTATIFANSGTINFTATTWAGTTAVTLGGSGNGTIAGAGATGAASIVKLGSGTWTLSGASTFTGTTTLYQGTIQYGANAGVGSGPLGNAGAITIFSGGVLDMNGFAQSATTKAITLNGFGIANGGAFKSSATSSFPGNRTINSDVRITSSSGTLTLSGTSTNAFETRLGGAGNFTLSGAWGAAASSVWKDGAGTASATIAQGWTGNTTVIAGTFQDGVLNGISSGPVIVNGGTFDIMTFTDTVGSVTLIDGTIAGSTGILTGIAYTLESGTISGIITGALAVVKNTASVVNITGVETISSTLTINAGEVQFSGNGTATSVTGVTINLGGTLTLDNSTTSVADRLNGTGGTNAIVVTMNGGNFNFKGNASGTAAETLGQLAIAAGHNIVTETPGAGGSTTLTWATNPGLNRTAGATVLFRGTSFGSAAAANVSTMLFTTAPTLTGANGGSNNSAISIIKGAYGDGSLSGTGTDMVTYNQGDTTGLRLLNGAGHTGEYAANFGTNNANVKLTGNTNAASQNVNSLILNGGGVADAGTAQTITTAGSSLAGNILISSANNIAGANTVFALTAATEMTVLATANSTITALIGNSTTGLVTFSGNGNVSLGAAQTYTGTTTINKATITETVAGAISTGGVTVVGGTFDANSNTESVGAITVTGGTIKSGATVLTTTGTLTTNANANVSTVITGNLGLPAAATINIADGLVEDDAIISAIISGAGTSLTKSTGTGVVVLSGNNSFTGSTAINAGTVKLGIAGSAGNGPLGTVGTGTVVGSGAVLDLNGITLGNATEALSIAGTGISSGGALINTMSAAATYPGLLTLATAAPQITANYGDINISNAGNITGTFNLTLSGSGNGSITSNLNISTATLTKSGFGTWTLSGAVSTFTGAISIATNGGVLKLGASGDATNTPLGTNAGGIAVGSGGVFDMSGYTIATTEALSLNGTGIANCGALTTSSGSATSYAGAITLAAAARLTNYGAGTFSFSGAIAGAFQFTLVSSPGTIAQTSASAWTGVAGGFTKEGSGVATLAGLNANTGAITVSTGTLQMAATGNGTNSPIGTNAGGITVSAGAVLDLSTFNVNNGGTEALSSVSGTGIKNGGAIISSATVANTFGALTTPASTNTRINNSGSGLVTISGTVSGTTAGSIFIGGSGPTTISGSITSTFMNLIKNDAGTLILSGASNGTTTGITRINGGTLKYGVANAINTSNVTVAGGTLDINAVTDTVGTVTILSGTITNTGAAATLTATTSYTFESGTVSVPLGGTTLPMAKNTGGVLSISSALTNTGTLTVNAGTVQYGASNVLADTSPVTVAGGTLDIGANSDTVAAVTLTSGGIVGSTGVLTGASYAVASGSISAILAGAGNVTKTTTGTVTLSGTNTYTGITNIQAGTLSVGTIGNGLVAGNLGAASNARANLVSSTGTGTLQYTGSSASTDRNITGTDGITLNVDITNPATTLTISGVVTNSAGIATTASVGKFGPGTLQLSGANLYTGVTSVMAGTLQYLATNVLSTGAVSVINGTLDMNSFSDSVGTVTLQNGGQIIDSSGTGVLTSTATFALQSGKVSARLGGVQATAINKTTTDRVILSGDNTFTGTAVTAGVGSLNLQNDNALGASGQALTLTITAGANIELQNNITIPSTKSITANSTGINNGGAIENVADANTLQSAITLATNTTIGCVAGTLSLAGSTTGGASIGLTKVGAGTLSVAATTLGGSLTISAGTLSAAGDISVGGSWTNNGTFTANSSTVSLTSNTTAVITGNTTFNNFSVTGIGSAKTITFAASSTQTVTGTWTVTGASGQIVTLQSGGSPTKWNINPTAASVSWVAVTDSNNQGVVFCATNSTGSNNTGWNIGAGASCPISVSGTVYQSGNESNVFDCNAVNLALRVSVNGAAATSGTCSAVGGTFTVSGVTGPSGADIPISVYTDNAANPSQKATTVTLSAGAVANITGIVLIIDRLVVSQESATPITNTHLDTANNNGDVGIRYGVTGGALTVNAGMELHVLAGKTFIPGGTVTTNPASSAATLDGDVHVPTTATLNMGNNALNIGGDVNNGGTLTISAGQTTTFTATGTGFTINLGSTTMQNVTYNGSGGGWAIGASFNVVGTFSLIAGAVTSNATVNITGIYSQTGGTFIQGANTTATFSGATFTLSNGTTWTKTSGSGKLVFDGNVTFTDSNTTKQNLGVVQIGASPGTTTLASDMSADSVTIPTTDTLNTKGYDITTTGAFDCQGTCTLDMTDTAPNNEGDGTTLDIGGNFTMSSSATLTAATSVVYLDSTNAANTNRTFTTGGSSYTYNHVSLSNAGSTNKQITISGNLVVGGDLSISNGTVLLNSGNPTVTTAGNVTFSSGITVTKGSGAWTFNGTAAKTYTDNTATPQNIGTVAITKTNGTPANNTVTLASSMTVDTMTISANNTLDLASSGYTLKLANAGATNTVLTVSGTLTPNSNSTVQFSATNSGGTIVVPATTYNNLKISGNETYDLGGNLTSTNALTGGVTIDTGGATLDAVSGSNYSIALGGNWINNGTFTARTGTVTMTGTANLGGTTATTFNNLTIDGSSTTVSVITQQPTVSGTLTVADTLSIGGGLSVTSGTAGTVTLAGTGANAITGTGSLVVKNSNLSAAGTIGTSVQFNASSGNISMPARTYGGNVDLFENSSSPRTVTMLAGNYSITGDVTIIGNQDIAAGVTTLDGATNLTGSHTVTIGGSLIGTDYAGSELATISLGGARWKIGTNFDMSFITTLTAGTSTLEMTGTGSVITNGKTLNNLDINSSGTVSLANATHTISGNVTMVAGALALLGSATMNVGGNLDLSAGTVAANSSTIVMTGATKTITGGNKTLNNLTISGTPITLQTSNLTVGGALSIGASNTLTITTVTLTDTGGNISWGASSVIGGTGLLTFTDTAGGPATGGTLSVPVRFDASSANVPSTTFDARTYGGAVELYANSGTGKSISTAAGAYSFSSTLTITTAGVGATTLDMNTTDPTTFTVSGTLTVGASSILQATSSGTFNVGASFTNNGTFTHNSGTVNLTTATAATITGSTTFQNLSISGIGAAKAITVVHGTTTTVAGTWTVAGAVGQIVTLTRDNTSAWTINPTAATVDYANVSWSNSGLAICATHSTDGGNNNGNWAFSAGTACGVTISGTVFDDWGSTPTDCTIDGLTVYVHVGTTTHSASCAVDGTYTITGVTIPSAGSVITTFLSAPASAVTVSRAASTGADISAMDVYAGTVLLTHEDAGPITNANAGVFDGDDNPLIPFTSNSNALVTSAYTYLMVQVGKTYLPGGTVTTGTAVGMVVGGTATIDTATSSFGGDISLWSGASLTINASMNVAGTIGAGGTGTTVTTTSGTPTVTLTGGTTSLTLGGSNMSMTFYNLALAGSTKFLMSGSGAKTINGTLSVASGTTFAPSSSVSIVGSLTTTGTGAITYSSTPTVTVQGATIGGGSGDITFYNLTKSGAGATAWSGTGTNGVKNNLTLSAGTLTAPSGFLALGNLVESGGSFVHNSGSLMFNSLSSQTLNVASTLNNVTFNNGLVGYWNFDETSGIIAHDQSGYGYDGTAAYTPTISTDVPTLGFANARSLGFNGTSQYVDMGNPAFLNSEFGKTISLSAWIKPSSLGGGHVVVGKSYADPHSGNFYQWSLFQSGASICFRIMFTNICSSGTGGGALTTGWQNVSAVYNGTNMYVYINGTQVATTAATATVDPSLRNVRVAGRDTPSGMGEYFGGNIDDVRIYRRALSTTEISSLASGNQLETLSSVKYTLGHALTAAGNLSVIDGALDVDTTNHYDLNVGGNWTNLGGVFSARTGTVTLNGSAQQTLSGTLTGASGKFNALTITNSSGSNPDTSPSVIFANGVETGGLFSATGANVKLRFASSATNTINNISLNGTTGNPVTLRSSTPGTAAIFTVASGSPTVTNTSVQDNNASASNGGSGIDASAAGNNIDMGNNLGWLINTLAVSLSGTTVNLSSPTALDPAHVNYQGIDSTVTTNAPGGYVSVVSYSGPMSSGSTTWADAGGTVTAGTSGFGATTSKSSQTIATTTAPSCATTLTQNNGPYAATSLSTTPKQFASSTSAVTADATRLCLLGAISPTQESGAYATTITVVTTARF